jgi:hypothetical protein
MQIRTNQAITNNTEDMKYVRTLRDEGHPALLYLVYAFLHFTETTSGSSVLVDATSAVSFPPRAQLLSRPLERGRKSRPLAA